MMVTLLCSHYVDVQFFWCTTPFIVSVCLEYDSIDGVISFIEYHHLYVQFDCSLTLVSSFCSSVQQINAVDFR